MLLVKAVRQWHKGFIPPVVSRLVATDKQHGIPLRVEKHTGPGSGAPCNGYAIRACAGSGCWRCPKNGEISGRCPTAPADPRKASRSPALQFLSHATTVRIHREEHRIFHMMNIDEKEYISQVLLESLRSLFHARFFCPSPRARPSPFERPPGRAPAQHLQLRIATPSMSRCPARSQSSR